MLSGPGRQGPQLTSKDGPHEGLPSSRWGPLLRDWCPLGKPLSNTAKEVGDGLLVTIGAGDGEYALIAVLSLPDYAMQ